MADPLDFKFRAFLSYSHADKAWAKWLHKRIEAFKIDRDLHGRQTAMGPVPKTLRPIFRDRDEFTAGHTLTEQTLAALDNSAAMIVICSPASAKSHYVNEEIRLYKSRHPNRPIVPVIINGQPGSTAPTSTVIPAKAGTQTPIRTHDASSQLLESGNQQTLLGPDLRRGDVPEGASDECFPPALRFEVTPDGTITNTPLELLAADVREDADGKALALAKVVAALIAVPVDDVRKRQGIAESRRIKILAAVATAFAVLALFAGFLWWQHERQQTQMAQRDSELRGQLDAQRRQMADQRQQFAALARQLTLVSSAKAASGSQEAVGKAVTAAATGAAKGDARLKKALELLKAGKAADAEPLFRTVAEEKAARVTRDQGRIESDKKQAAAAYRNLGAIAGLGDPKRAREAYAKALELDPDDSESLYWHGYLSYWAGDLVRAEQSLERLRALSSRQGNPQGLVRAHTWLGMVMIDRGQLAAAREQEEQAIAVAQHQVNDWPEDPAWKMALSEAQIRLGEVHVGEGNLSAADKVYRSALAVRKQVAARDQQNARWQRDLWVSYGKVADILMAQGNLSGGLTNWQAAHDITQRLAARDPENAGWQRDLSVSHENIGNVLKAQGDLAGALKSFQASLAIAERLAAGDPGNASWQRDLSVSHQLIGDVLDAQGDLGGALNAYRDSFTIRELLAASHPENAGWQRDLSVSHDRIGDVLIAQGDLGGALAAFQKSLAIRERLAASDPKNAGWQRDLSVSYNRIGDIEAAIGNANTAIERYEASLAIVKALAAKWPDHPLLQSDVAITKRRLEQLRAKR